jgi:phosphatidylglycerophosphate synthase
MSAMDGGQALVAEVIFANARAASRRIAGVAAAGRIVRELAEAGFASAWLVLPAGDTLDRSATADIRRLAGQMMVRIGRAPAGQDPLTLPGDRLIPAPLIRGFLADDPTAHPSIIDLTGSKAGREILLRTAKTTDGPVSRWLNRPISRQLSALLLRISGFTPFHASIGTALLAAAMFAALMVGGEDGLIAGALLFQAASVFDGVDGEVARATFRSSAAGARLDTAIDTMTTLLFVVGLTMNLGSSGHEHVYALAGWGLALFLVGLGLIAWHSAGLLDFRRIKRHYQGRFAGAVVPRLIAFATLVTSRDFFTLLFAVLTVAGYPLTVVYLFAAAASIWILFVAGSIFPSRKPALAPEKA